jgi:hypothetical protein
MGVDWRRCDAPQPVSCHRVSPVHSVPDLSSEASAWPILLPSRWLRTASIGGFNPLLFAVGVLSVLFLSLVRLLSERPLGRSRKEPPMNTKKHRKSKRNTNSPKGRHFAQYVLETIWAGYAGAAVGCWQP